MFGDWRLAETQAMYHVADRAWPVTQKFDDLKTAGLGQRLECGHHGEREYASMRIFLSRHILVEEYIRLVFNKLLQVTGSRGEGRATKNGRRNRRAISIGKGFPVGAETGSAATEGGHRVDA